MIAIRLADSPRCPLFVLGLGLALLAAAAAAGERRENRNARDTLHGTSRRAKSVSRRVPGDAREDYPSLPNVDSLREAEDRLTAPPPQIPPPSRRLSKIGELTASIDPQKGPSPPDLVAKDEDPFDAVPLERAWAMVEVNWEASALGHYPLYFEDVGLERHGHTVCPWLQPGISAAKFYTSVIVLPYKMGADPPHQCVYALGHYRPGGRAPRIVYRPLFSVRGAAAQAAVMTGGAFVFP